MSKAKLVQFYKKNYRNLLVIPILFFILSLFSIAIAMSNDGTPIYRDVSLKGGLSAILTVDSSFSADEVKVHLQSQFSDNTFKVSELFEQGQKVGFIVDTDANEEAFLDVVNTYFGVEFTLGDNYVSNFISPSLSNSFFQQAIIILLISFFFMSLVIFLYFREVVPSVAMIVSVIFDIVVTIGVLDAFGFEISIAGIGALLMLIGYSIDTDVLLSNRLVKEHGDNYFEKVDNAWRTGSLMTGTTLVAGLTAMFLTNSEIIFEITLILVVGLLVDYVSTWIQNVAILLWWLEKK